MDGWSCVNCGDVVDEDQTSTAVVSEGIQLRQRFVRLTRFVFFWRETKTTSFFVPQCMQQFIFGFIFKCRIQNKTNSQRAQTLSPLTAEELSDQTYLQWSGCFTYLNKCNTLWYFYTLWSLVTLAVSLQEVQWKDFAVFQLNYINLWKKTWLNYLPIISIWVLM